MSKKKTIFQLLTEKPWEQDQIEADNEHQGQTVNLTKQKLGLRTLIAASTVLFSLFIVAYSDRMLVHDWRNMPEPWLLWFNTGILVISSIVFHQTTKYAEKEIFDKTRNCLYFIGFLAYSFLIGVVPVGTTSDNEDEKSLIHSMIVSICFVINSVRCSCCVSSITFNPLYVSS